MPPLLRTALIFRAIAASASNRSISGRRIAGEKYVGVFFQT